MKKLSILAIAIACSTPAFADNFTGFGIGAEADIIKYSSGTHDERITDANIVGSYAFAHHDFLVSGFDAKVGVTSPRLANTTVTDTSTNLNITLKTEQKYNVGLGYRLGYNGFHDKVLPYAKVSYEHLAIEGKGSVSNGTTTVSRSFDETVNGYGFGVGIKYEPIKNIELGAEYTRKKYDSNDYGTSSDFDVNSFAIGGAYRF